MLLKCAALAQAKALPGRPSTRPANHRGVRIQPHANACVGHPSHARPARRSLCLHEREAPVSGLLAHQLIQAQGIASGFSEQAQSRAGTFVFRVRITHTAVRLRWVLDREVWQWVVVFGLSP